MTNRMTNEEAIKELEYVKQQTGYADTALDKAITALKQTRWIPVSERLPTEIDTYEVTISGTSELEGTIEIAFATWLNDDWLYHDVDDWQYKEVIAWKPLPQPYRAESEESE